MHVDKVLSDNIEDMDCRLGLDYDHIWRLVDLHDIHRYVLLLTIHSGLILIPDQILLSDQTLHLGYSIEQMRYEELLVKI
jgi:hypothetical protein